MGPALPGLLVALLTLAAIGLPQGALDEGSDPPTLAPTVVETELTVVLSNPAPGASTWKPSPWEHTFELHNETVHYRANVSLLQASTKLHDDLVTELQRDPDPPCARAQTPKGGGAPRCIIRGVQPDNVTRFLVDRGPADVGQPIDPARTLFVLNLSKLGDHAFLQQGVSPPYGKIVPLADFSDTWTDPRTGLVIVDAAANTSAAYGGSALSFPPPSKRSPHQALDQLAANVLDSIVMAAHTPTLPPIQGDLTISFTTVVPEDPRFDPWVQRASAAGGPGAEADRLSFLRDVEIEDEGVVRDDALTDGIERGSTVQNGSLRLDIRTLQGLFSTQGPLVPPANGTTRALVLAYDRPVFIDAGGDLAQGWATWPEEGQIPVALAAFDTTLRDGRHRNATLAAGYWQAQKNLLANLMVHEVGHVLSLPHPHDRWGPADASLSPMSYRINTGEHIYPFTRWDKQTYARNQMVGEIAALKDAYERTHALVQADASSKAGTGQASPQDLLVQAADTIADLDALVRQDPFPYEPSGRAIATAFQQDLAEATEDIERARALSQPAPGPADPPKNKSDDGNGGDGEPTVVPGWGGALAAIATLAAVASASGRKVRRR